MKLIVLYGPPAVGKYTVAKLLAEKTGYKFFHNHLTIDVVKAILPFGAPGFFELSDKIRLEVFKEAAKQNISGLIFTFVFTRGKGEKFIQSIIETLSSYDVQIEFIQLYCGKEQLLKRIEGQHRKDMNKLTSPDELSQLLEQGNLQSAIPNVESSRIDNTNLSVEETANKALDLIAS